MLFCFIAAAARHHFPSAFSLTAYSSFELSAFKLSAFELSAFELSAFELSASVLSSSELSVCYHRYCNCQSEGMTKWGVKVGTGGKGCYS